MAGRSQCKPQVDLAFTNATTRCRGGEIRHDCHPFSALERIPATFRELHCRTIRGKSEVSAQCHPENKKQKTAWRWTQSLANSSPFNFPANREKYRELSPFARNP